MKGKSKVDESKEPLLDGKLDFTLNESRIPLDDNTRIEDDKAFASFIAGPDRPAEDDLVINNTERTIDFDQELKELKQRTELDIPYVSTMCEDAMYIDPHTVVTIEYHYYQNDCQYTSLSVVDEHINS